MEKWILGERVEMILKRYGCEECKKIFKKWLEVKKFLIFFLNEKIEIMNPPEGGGEKK